ncbi:MAG: hypothetical protein M1838_004487 [Thelocarpon superellum]|nr:MAG: hypothetical protein M1838_004487 [Thelocarpon superellum]
MDSMRTLNTSLPGSSPKARARDPPEQLMQSFRAAALSVTTLYKIAAADESRAHRAGYQEALDELLAFLDHENLGLDDGEGWTVRQWATERLDGSHTSVDSEDEKGEMTTRARSSSPAPPRNEAREEIPLTRRGTRSASPVRTSSAPPNPPSAAAPVVSDSFTFCAGVSYPPQHDTDMISDDAESAPSASKSTQISPITNATFSSKTDGLSRSSRHRHSGHSRMTTRASSINALPAGTGYKRRFPFGELFDLGSVGIGRDGSSPGKRGRYL